MKTQLALIPLALFALQGVRADPRTLLSDDFSSDTTANYYLSSGNAASYSVADGRLTLASGRSIFTYFEVTSLEVGDNITVTFNFEAPAWGSANAGFRFGLFNSNDTTIVNFNNTQYTPFTGYSGTTNPVGAATNPMVLRTRNLTNSALLTTNEAFTSIGNSGGVQNQSFVVNESYTGVFSVTRTGLLTNDLTFSISGSGLSDYTITRTHTSDAPETVGSIVTTFDGFALSTTNAVLNTGVIHLDNIVVTTTAIPEPSAFAALAGLGVLGLAVARRRRV